MCATLVAMNLAPLEAPHGYAPLTPDEWVTRWGLYDYGAYAGDDKDVIRQMPGHAALHHRFIQANPRALVNAVVLDVDHPQAVFKALERPRNHPDPSWVIETTNGAHVGWWLAEPVTRTDVAREKPLRLLARIQQGLAKELDADPNYTGFITRSPVYPALKTGDVLWGSKRSYELNELRTPSIPRQLARKPANIQGDLGRNCCLFEQGRHHAYAIYRHQGYPGYNALLPAVTSILIDLNSQFPTPLPLTEVKQIANSIATWTAKHHTKQNFTSIQRTRGRRSAKARQSNRDEQLRTALK